MAGTRACLPVTCVGNIEGSLKVHELLAQELVTAIGVIAGRIGHDKFADKCKHRAVTFQYTAQRTLVCNCQSPLTAQNNYGC